MSTEEPLSPEEKARHREKLDACLLLYAEAVKISGGMLPSVWAQEERYLGHGESWNSQRAPRRFSFDEAPYQLEPQDAPLEPEVQTTVYLWASDMGKTALEANLIGYHIDRDPAKILVAYPNDKSAETWSKDVLSVMIDATPRVKDKVRPAKSRDSTNTIAHKKFAGGSVSCISVQTPSALRQRRARVAIGDEIDAWPGDVGGEGDPVSLLFKRTEGYSDSVQILSSTPTIKGRSRIENWFNRSDKRYWFVCCKKCQHEQTLKWAQIRWPEGEHESAKVHCERQECDYGHSDAERKEIIRKGRWMATAPFKGVRGYHLSGIYSLFPAKKGYVNKLHQMAQDFSDAVHSANPKGALRVWKNTFLAETDEDEAEPQIEWETLFARREDYITEGQPIICPPLVRIITGGIDFQGDRFELEFVGWDRWERSYGLQRMQIPCDPTDERSYDQLEAAIAGKQFLTESGAKLDVRVMFADAGKWSDFVYRFCNRPGLMRRVFPVKGANQPDAPLLSDLRTWKRKFGSVQGYLIGTNAAKEVLYGRARLQATGDGTFPPGYMHFPSTYPEAFFKQLVIEKQGRRFVKGQMIPVFYKEDERNDRNEALDIRVYALAAFRFFPWNFDTIDQFLETADQEKKRLAEQRPAQRPVPPPTPQRKSGGRNWVMAGISRRG